VEEIQESGKRKGEEFLAKRSPGVPAATEGKNAFLLVEPELVL